MKPHFILFSNLWWYCRLGWLDYIWSTFIWAFYTSLVIHEVGSLHLMTKVSTHNNYLCKHGICYIDCLIHYVIIVLPGHKKRSKDSTPRLASLHTPCPCIHSLWSAVPGESSNGGQWSCVTPRHSTQSPFASLPPHKLLNTAEIRNQVAQWLVDISL